MMINGRIFWDGAGWYASRVEGDTGMEVVLPLECSSDSKRLPTQAQSEEARQKGLGSPFYLTEIPSGFENLSHNAPKPRAGG